MNSFRKLNESSIDPSFVRGKSVFFVKQQNRIYGPETSLTITTATIATKYQNKARNGGFNSQQDTGKSHLHSSDRFVPQGNEFARLAQFGRATTSQRRRSRATLLQGPLHGLFGGPKTSTAWQNENCNGNNSVVSFTVYNAFHLYFIKNRNITASFSFTRREARS